MSEREPKYRLIDGNIAKSKPPAYCKAKHGYLSVGQVKSHHCLSRKPNGCCSLEKFPHEYWDEREQRKKLKKERRKLIINKS